MSDCDLLLMLGTDVPYWQFYPSVKGLIHPQQIVSTSSEHASLDAVFTCDVGQPTVAPPE